MQKTLRARSRKARPVHLLMEQLETRWAMAASLSLVGPSGVVYEGDKANFTLTLSEPVRTPERVLITTTPGTATYGTDYFAQPSTQVLFSPGETRKNFAISTLREAVNRIEGIETFQVVATPANSALGIRSATVRIDDYLPPPLISVSDVSVVEGNSGATPATFVVTLSAANNRPVTIAYATRDGTATVADNDYTATSGTLTFAPGETSKSVTVNVVGDRKLESDETFSLVLSPPVYGVLRKGTGVATIRNDETDQPGFQITVNYLGTVLPAVQTAVTRAVAKWQQVIVGDVPSFVNPFNGQWVDDIVLDVRMGLLGPDFPVGTDGATGPNTIANAGPFFGGAPGVIGQLAIRDTPRLPYWGTIGFDPANAQVDPPTELYTTALHEIGHALGFGNPLFREPRAGYAQGLVVPLQGNAVYVGSNAVRAFNEIFQTNATSIRMESTGGGGTAGVHWDQYTLPGELMVGYATGGFSPLSKVTIGAMQDLGYSVNPLAADTYPSRNGNANISAGTGGQATSPKSAVTVAYSSKTLPQISAMASGINYTQPEQSVASNSLSPKSTRGLTLGLTASPRAAAFALLVSK